jgi:hypothetical protein
VTVTRGFFSKMVAASLTRFSRSDLDARAVRPAHSVSGSVEEKNIAWLIAERTCVSE